MGVRAVNLDEWAAHARSYADAADDIAERAGPPGVVVAYCAGVSDALRMLSGIEIEYLRNPQIMGLIEDLWSIRGGVLARKEEG